MTEKQPCSQGGCSELSEMSTSVKSLVEGMGEIRGYLKGYEERFDIHVEKFENHMNNEEVFAAKLTKSIECLTTEVRNLKTKDATDDAKKEGVVKTIRAAVIFLAVFGSIVGFVWMATGAQITFGG